MTIRMAFETCVLGTALARVLIAQTHIAMKFILLGALPLLMTHLFASEAGLKRVLLIVS
jgi:hypothetical protein